MSNIKTVVSEDSVKDFINSVDNELQKQDAFTLLEIFTRLTGESPKMWGSSIIGFGEYHYKSDRSKQEGDWPLIGFSPRKQNLTLYFMLGFEEYTELLSNLGKHKTSKGCLYITRLSNVDVPILEQLITHSYSAMKQKYSSD